MKEAEKGAKKRQERKEKQVEAAKVREALRKSAFVPPPEKSHLERKKEKEAQIAATSSTSTEVDVERLKKKVKSHIKKQKKSQLE